MRLVGGARLASSTLATLTPEAEDAEDAEEGEEAEEELLKLLVLKRMKGLKGECGESRANTDSPRQKTGDGGNREGETNALGEGNRAGESESRRVDIAGDPACEAGCDNPSAAEDETDDAEEEDEGIKDNVGDSTLDRMPVRLMEAGKGNKPVG